MWTSSKCLERTIKICGIPHKDFCCLTAHTSLSWQSPSSRYKHARHLARLIDAATRSAAELHVVGVVAEIVAEVVAEVELEVELKLVALVLLAVVVDVVLDLGVVVVLALALLLLVLLALLLLALRLGISLRTDGLAPASSSAATTLACPVSTARRSAVVPCGLT